MSNGEIPGMQDYILVYSDFGKKTLNRSGFSAEGDPNFCELKRKNTNKM